MVDTALFHRIAGIFLLIVINLTSGDLDASEGTILKGLHAPWPPPARQLRVVIDTDAANEIDDQYALALALGFPERLKIEGFVAAHFGETGGDEGVKKSYTEIVTLLKILGKENAYPIKCGLGSLNANQAIPNSAGVDFIIQQAMSATPSEPLWLIALGPATNAVAALRKEPRIADRMIVFWHGRSNWPTKCQNFNATNDPVATRQIFDIPSRFVLFDTGAQLNMPLQESLNRIATRGFMGSYLHQIRSRNPIWLHDEKGIYDLADIAALIAPEATQWEIASTPAVRKDLTYDFSQSERQLVRIYDIDRIRSFDLLDVALSRLRRLPSCKVRDGR